MLTANPFSGFLMVLVWQAWRPPGGVPLIPNLSSVVRERLGGHLVWLGSFLDRFGQTSSGHDSASWKSELFLEPRQTGASAGTGQIDDYLGCAADPFSALLKEHRGFGPD